MKKQTIGLGILAIAVISGVAFFAVEKNKKTPAVETPMVEDTVPTPEPEELSGKIDEHLTINNELRDVNFCGKTYKVKQVLIDGVDVVQRVAEIVVQGLISESFKGYYGKEGTFGVPEKGEVEKQICGNARLGNTSSGEVIESTVRQSFSGEDIGGFGEEIYPVSIAVSPVTAQAFYIALPSGNIYMDDGFSGTLIGPIGNLK